MNSSSTADRRLLVKVVKAVGLGCKRGMFLGKGLISENILNTVSKFKYSTKMYLKLG